MKQTATCTLACVACVAWVECEVYVFALCFAPFAFLSRLCFPRFFDVNGFAKAVVMPLVCACDGKCLFVHVVAALVRVHARVCVSALVLSLLVSFRFCFVLMFS